MEQDIKIKVRQLLTNYLEANHCRKTPERYAVLDAAYSMGAYFTMDELVEKLEELDFAVSRATLYNSIRLFVKFRLVIRHRFQGGTKYEACCANESHCHQVCTICGKVTEIDVPHITKAISDVKLKRFRTDCYTLYIYGLCSSCQTRLSKSKKRTKKKKSKK